MKMIKDIKPQFKALNLAKYIIGKCTKDQKYITNLGLQRMLYYMQREFLQLGRLAFSEELEAWEFGPCILDVYRVYSGYGGSEIHVLYDITKLEFESEDIKKIVDRTLMIYRSKSMFSQVEEICTDGGPWAIIWDNGKGNHRIIPKELIKKEG